MQNQKMKHESADQKRIDAEGFAGQGQPVLLDKNLGESLQTLKGLIEKTRENIAPGNDVRNREFQNIIEYLQSIIENTVTQTQRAAVQNLDILAPHEKLTKREQQVLKFVASGYANKNIATELQISIRTAEAHRANLTKKLGIKTTAGLVKYAIAHNLI